MYLKPQEMKIDFRALYDLKLQQGQNVNIA